MTKGRIERVTIRTLQTHRLLRLKQRDLIVGDSEDILHIDWLSEWRELK